MSELQHAIDWYKEGERDVDFVQYLAELLMAALAERDRMLRLALEHEYGSVQMDDEYFKQLSDLLRDEARAEEGSECPACPECHVADVLGTGIKHLRGCSRAEELRGSGRTTRMIERARRLDKEGRAVYIIAANAEHRHRLASMVEDRPSIKVETPSSMGNFDWMLIRPFRAHPNCVTLVDHYTIESRYAKVLEELHAYDPPERRAP